MNTKNISNATQNPEPPKDLPLFEKYQSLFSGQTFDDIKVLHRALKIVDKNGLHRAGVVAFYTAGAVASILPGVDIRPIVRGNAVQNILFGVQIHNTVRGTQSSSLPLVQSVYDAHDGQFAQGGYTGEKNVHENAFNGILTLGQKISHEKGEKSLTSKMQDLVFKGILNEPRLHGYKIVASEGEENIPETNAIFATTHLTESDVPLSANELHKMGRDISVISQKTNLELKNSFGLPQSAGKNRFLPIQNHKRKEKIQGSEWGYTLNHQDFIKFRDVIASGKDLIIAGHRPTHDGKLPPRMGIGAILMGFITGKPIVPINIETPKNKKQKIFYNPKISLPVLNEEEKQKLNDWLDGKIPLDKKIIQKAGEVAEQLRNIYTKVEKK